MPYPNQHAARIVDPDSFIKDSFRTKEIAPGITLILGKKTEGGPMETQAYRFDKDKFTEQEARDWLKSHDLKPISFEKAISNLSAIDNEGSFSHSSHDITLQRLDIYLPYAGVSGGKLKYNIDNFEGTEDAWNRTLAVFVPPGIPIQHVDHAAFVRDPHGEARRLGFRIAGHHENTRVITNGPGEPRVSTQAVFTDPEADQLAREGKLSPSSGFDADIVPDGYMAGQVIPNHVLYFLRNEKTAFSTPATPNDMGAMVNNLSQENTMPDEEVKGMFSKILETVTPKENPLKATVDNLNAEIAKRDAQINTLTEENAALKVEKTALDNLRAEQEKSRKDGQWTQIKNLYKPGLFHKKEDEDKLRTEFEKDPVAFQLANVGNLQTAKPQAAQGASAVGNLGEDETKPFDVGAARGTLDPKTGTFTGGQ
jgi:regulator of replication initiation timing